MAVLRNAYSDMTDFPTEPKGQIEALRQNIDQIDRDLVRLLNERLQFAMKIGAIKNTEGGAVYVPKREEEVLTKVANLNAGPMPENAIRAIYREIMSASISMERKTVVAYLGPVATYTQQAAVKKFGASLDYVAYPGIGDVFHAVERGEADYGVVPIENSSEGAVFHSLDMFIESDLKVVSQIYLDIVHNLISVSPLSEIKTVYSKDQAIGQCRRWLSQHLPNVELVSFPSTAAAVEKVKGMKGAAAIASGLAAELYEVPIAAAAIQDRMNNVTRFLVLGKNGICEPLGEGRDKTSLLISLTDEVGILERILVRFSKRNLNLSKIESRPSGKRLWEYVFFIDLVGHYQDPVVREAIEDVKSLGVQVKWLGSYPNSK